MDVLIVERLDPAVLRWLAERHALRVAPELARDERALRDGLALARAAIIAPSIGIDATHVKRAAHLRAIGVVGGGPDHVDVRACAAAGIEVVRSGTASANAEAEFMIGALLTLLRRVPVTAPDGALVGRELYGATIGLVGMMPASRVMAQLLSAFGARVVGYDPAVHASDELWARWHIEPVPLVELFDCSDGVCVQLAYYSRYRGLLGERFLPFGKPDQVLVSTSHSNLFDARVLAEVLASGRLAAAWFDSMEPAAMEPGQPLHDAPHLQVTPRLAGTTREARERSAWAVARRIDELISARPDTPGFKPTAPDGPPDPEAGPA